MTLANRVTFGEWVETRGINKHRATVYLNNHNVGFVRRWKTEQGENRYTLYDTKGSQVITVRNIMELVPFVGYSMEGNEF